MKDEARHVYNHVSKTLLKPCIHACTGTSEIEYRDPIFYETEKKNVSTLNKSVILTLVIRMQKVLLIVLG